MWVRGGLPIFRCACISRTYHVSLSVCVSVCVSICVSQLSPYIYSSFQIFFLQSFRFFSDFKNSDQILRFYPIFSNFGPYFHNFIQISISEFRPDFWISTRFSEFHQIFQNFIKIFRILPQLSEFRPHFQKMSKISLI